MTPPRKSESWGLPLLALVLFFIVVLPAHCAGQSFYGVGISLLPQTSPKPTGWAAAIITANAKQRLYSISEIDFTLIGNLAKGQPVAVQTSARTGAALWMRSFGAMDVYTLADGGAATAGTSSSGAGALGMMGVFPTRWTGLRGTVGFRVLKTALTSTQGLVELGLVFGGGK